MKKKPPHVTHYRDRHRKVRWRFRKRGLPEVQTALPYDSKDWWEWYFAALNAERREIAAERTGPGTFNALIVAFYQSSDWKGLGPVTQRTTRGEMERFRAEHGDKRVADLLARHIKAMMDKKADRPAAANGLHRVLRKLMAFAKDRGWRRDDPAIEVKRLRYKSDGFHSWTEEEIAKFEAKWPLGTRERLALDLLLCTGQRSGDVRQMTAGQVQGGYIAVRQEKTGAQLQIPVHEALAASLAACRSNHLLLLPTAYGEPYTAKGWGNWFSAAASKAGLPGCTAHGLRKAAARRLAEAGATAHEIMAITGHRSLAEAERYTRGADQKINAKAAMEKVEKTERERKNV